MALDIFSTIDSALKSPIEEFIENGITNLSNYLGPPLSAALLLYIVIYGILIIQGSISEPVVDFAVRGMKLAIIVALVRNTGAYNQYVKGVFFTTLPMEIGNAITSSGSVVGVNAFDTMLSKGFLAGTTILKTTSITNLGPIFLAIFVFLLVAFGTVIAYGVFIFAQVALSVVLVLGPVFISFAMFQPTRRFTESWLGSLANYVILQILVITVLTLVIGMVDAFATKWKDNEDVMFVGLAYIIVFVLVGWIAFQLPAIASALAGGGATLGTNALQSIASSPYTAARAALSGRKVASKTAAQQKQLAQTIATTVAQAIKGK